LLFSPLSGGKGVEGKEWVEKRPLLFNFWGGRGRKAAITVKVLTNSKRPKVKRHLPTHRTQFEKVDFKR
jgi:hypothetical protein